jgi:predicted dehydrogenase
MEKINISIVGCGAHSHLHANAAAAFPEVTITSCCDIDSSRSKIWADKYKCRDYTNITEMINSEKPDAVILCTWPNQHLEQIKECLTAGIKNILCEKSLTITSKDAFEIRDLVNSYGAYLMEGCMFRHHPAIRKVEELAFSSCLGKIDSIRASFSNYEPEAHKDKLNSQDWRYRKECGGGVTHDWMSYCVNAANYFSGSEPLTIFASGNHNKDYDVIDRVFSQISYENGIAAFIESSKHANFTQMLHISCANGIIQLPVAWGIYGDIFINVLHRKEKWGYIMTDRYEIEEADSFMLQLKNFLDVMKGKSKPLVSLDESVRNIHTVELIIQSITEKKSVSFS